MNAITTGPFEPRLSPQELRERWLRMIDDPLLAQIPYKLELNERGSMEVSPPTTRHAFLQAFVTGELRRLRAEGTTFIECSIETEIGIRVPDVAWASPQFMQRVGMVTPFPHAPELCVEILSPSNTRAEMKAKIAAYLAAGASEVWLVQESRTIEFWTRDGRQPASRLGIEISIPQ